MDKKKWIVFEILVEFIFIYVASFLSLLSILTSPILSSYGFFFLSSAFLAIGILLFTFVAVVFRDVLKNVEKLTKMKIAGEVEKRR